jgi:hypothetical protein
MSLLSPKKADIVLIVNDGSACKAQSLKAI